MYRGGKILTADAMHNSPANDAVAITMAKGCRSVCILIILREPFGVVNLFWLVGLSDGTIVVTIVGLIVVGFNLLLF